MKPLPAVFPAVFLIPAALFATPGTVLDDEFPNFSAAANVRVAVPAADGGVFLLGDFREIGGLARPGLARVTSNGAPDPTFEPDPLSFSARDLFALPTGRLMVLGQHQWILLDSDGTPNDTLLPDLPRDGTPLPRPRLLTDDRLFLITGDPAELRAYHAGDLSPEPSFAPSDSPLPPFEVAPAAGGGVWVLDHDPAEDHGLFSSGPFALRRLKPDGSPDPDFPRRELAANHRYQLRSAPDGGFRLIRENLIRHELWPIATSRGFIAESFDSEGGSLDEVGFPLPFGLDLDAVAIPDADQAVLPSLDTTRLERSVSGQVTRNDLAALNGPDAPFVSATDARTVDLLPDGRLLVGGTRRLLASGEPDPSWTEPELVGDAAVSGVVPLPEGRVLVHGNFHRLGQHFGTAGLANLSPVGAPDPTFRPDRDGRYIEKILPAPGGSFVALFDRPVSDSAGHRARLARLAADGRFLELLPASGGSVVSSTGGITDFAIQSDGSVLCSTLQNTTVPTAALRRILPDGTRDPDFPSAVPLDFADSLLVLPDDSFFRGGDRYSASGEHLESVTPPGSFGPGSDSPDPLPAPRPLLALSDGSVLFTPSRHGFQTGRPLYRWHPGTGLDPEFAADLGGTVAGAAHAAHDKLLVYGDLRISSGRLPLARLHADGRPDPSFRPPEAARIHAAARVGDELWVAGEFAGTDAPIIRLSDARAVGYDEWIAAATARGGFPASALGRESDPDGDGCSNFLEYAAASDPARPDPASCQPTRLGPLTWRLPCNPEAPEIVRRLKTSPDGVTWQPARADQVRLEATGTCLTWTLQPGTPTLLTRVRIE